MYFVCTYIYIRTYCMHANGCTELYAYIPSTYSYYSCQGIPGEIITCSLRDWCRVDFEIRETHWHRYSMATCR